MSRLHVFDMDGTLLEGSACFEISRSVGVLEENLQIEQAWIAGDLDDQDYWVRCLPLWKGLTDADIDIAFERAPWLDGISRVFGDIRERDEFSVVITQSPTFFAERLKRWGAHFAFGAHVCPGESSGAERMVSSDDKLAITHKLAGELDLKYDDCIAYGDSRSDLALFGTLSNTVAVNACEEIEGLAKASYQGGDLWHAYQVGRALLDGQTVI
ncbi:MAG: HAD family hydrolase [Gammaproteobacteria bacterium]